LLEDTRKLAEVQRIEDRREEYQGIIQRLGPLYEGGDTDWEGLVEAQSWVATLDTFDTVDTQPVIEALLDNSLPNVDPLLEQTTDALSQYDEAAEFFEGAMAVEEMTVNGTALNQALLSELSGLLGELREDVSKLQQRVQFASQLDTVRETICEEYVDQFLRGDYSSEHLVSAFEKRFYTKWLNSVYGTRISGRSTQTRWNGT